jgi:transcriptional regulator with XRE-family HTH domain
MNKGKTPIVMRIDSLLKAQNKGRKDLVMSIGVNRGVLTNWDKRETVPAADIALKIADYLGVSVRWLITGKDDRGLSLEERNLLVKYRCLDDRDQYEINALLDAKLEGVDLKKVGNP